jgi:DNA polymerase I-like protein with 3'-5' exonuclease and polymerase domains
MKKLSLPVPLVITPEHPFSPDTSGLLLVGNFGMTPTNSKGLVLVREAVKAANVNVGQVELVNINKKLEVEEITKLISEKLLTFHPSKIILFGNDATKAVYGCGHPALDVRKGYGGLGEWSTNVYLMPDPFHVVRNRFRARWLLDDLTWAVSSDQVVPTGTRTRWTPGAEKALFNQDLEIDTETFGHYADNVFRMLTMAVTVVGSTDILYWSEQDLVKDSPGYIAAKLVLQRAKAITAHNRKYDIIATNVWFGVNTKPDAAGDCTYVQARLLRADGAGGLEPLAPMVGVIGHKQRAMNAKYAAELTIENMRKHRMDPVPVRWETEVRINKAGRKQSRKVVVETRPPTEQEQDEQALKAFLKFKTKYPDICGTEEDWLAASRKGDDPAWYSQAFYDADTRDEYCAFDVMTGSLLARHFRQELDKEPDIKRVYDGVVRLAPRAFQHIEQTGINIDRQALDRFASFIDQRLLELDAKIQEVAAKYELARPFNAGSDEQLRTLLFNKLNLPVISETEGGAASTAAPVLKALKDHHPVVADVLDFKALRKMQSGYARGLIPHIRDDGAIHCSFNLMGTECMPAGELVLTNRGYIPVEQVRVNDQVISHTGTARAVTRVVNNGVKPVYRVLTADGNTLAVTGNHQFLTTRGWVRADQLNRDHEVLIHSTSEKWLAIAEWPGYQVSSWGRVVNTRTNHMLALQKKNKWGHLKVTLARNGARTRGADMKDFAVHRLVAEAFCPNPDNKPVVRHQNGISWDNTRDNLVWATTQENVDDTKLHCTALTRESSQNKLTIEQVELIRSTPRTEKSDRKLVPEFGVSRELIRDIRSGKKHPERTAAQNKATFVPSQVKEIKLLGEHETFGLSVDEDCSHVTGGIVTHNTGRVSCSEPNMQTIPSRGEYAKLAKSIYRARPGFKFVVMDYKTIEPMMVAVMSGDPTMLAAFNSGEDFHIRTAKIITMPVWGNDLPTWARKPSEPGYQAELVPEIERRRRIAKEIGLATLYGQGPDSMAERAGCTVEEAEKAQAAILDAYSVMRAWIKKCIAYAMQHGETWTVWNDQRARRRHTPDIGDSDSKLKGHGERISYNTPVQGSSHEKLLFAAVMCVAFLEKNGYRSRVALVVHDSIYFEVADDEFEEVVPAVHKIMVDQPFGELKLIVEAEVGETLADMHELKLAA